MTKKQIAIILSKLKPFNKPKEYLEQYISDSEIIAETLWQLHINNKLSDNIADFGAGTGIIGIGCLLLNKKVTFIEKDTDAIKVLKENLKDYKNYEIIELDIKNNTKNYDMIVMNPPFGTRNKGADKEFLDNAIRHSNKILSMHLTTTKNYIKNYLEKRGFKIIKEWDTKFPLKATFSHHKNNILRKNITIIYSENQLS